MIPKSDILRNLTILEVLYSKSPGNQKGLLYSKLAILELCGWTEVTMDEIVRKCAKRKIKDLSVIEKIEQKIIRPTYGFHYEEYFRYMLAYVIGEVSMQRLEKRVDQRKFLTMKSTLGTLNESRKVQAHTHLSGGNKRLDSPSVTKGAFYRVYEGLVEIDRKLRQLGL